MANIKETNAWEAGIYQLETTDPVVGGVDGISNKQAKQLANRTSYLKAQIERQNSDLDVKLAKKREINDSYSKAQTDNLLNAKLDAQIYTTEKAGFATKSEVSVANSAAANALSVANTKLGRAETAANSQALGGLTYNTLSSANTIVARDENGDFTARWVTASHYLMKTIAQDNLFDTNSEICFRSTQANTESPTHMRFASVAKLKEALGLSRGSVATSGWVGLSMGLIMQWGQIPNLGVGEAREILYPIAFPNWTLSVVATPGLPNPNNSISALHINGFFKEKFTIQNTDADSTYPAYWIALGY